MSNVDNYARQLAIQSLGSTTRAVVLANATHQVKTTPVIMPMHFGAMKGHGWKYGEPSGVQESTEFSDDYAAGVMAVEVEDASFFIDDMLIAFEGADGTWYSVVVRTVSGTTLNLAEPLPAAVSAGGLLGNFFNDYNHPQDYGSRAIVDTCLRDIGFAWTQVAQQRNYNDWYPYRPGVPITSPSSTIAANTTYDYGNPGTNYTGLQSAILTTTTPLDGARGRSQFLLAGRYRAIFYINVGHVVGTPNTANRLLCFINEQFPNNSANTVYTSEEIDGFDGVQRVVVEFEKSQASVVYPIVQCQLAGTSVAYLGAVCYERYEGEMLSLDYGVHVAPGNSWFYNPWLLDWLRIRYPNATIIGAGVNGDTIDEILARWDTDVVPYHPVAVWSDLGSTNNYAIPGSGTGKLRYEWGAGAAELARLCSSIGAQAMFFDSTVGSLTDPDGDPLTQLVDSRAFAMGLDLHEASATRPLLTSGQASEVYLSARCVATATFNGTGTMEVTAVASGVIKIGMMITNATGSGLPINLKVLSGPAAGGVGTYTVSNNVTAAVGVGIHATQRTVVAISEKAFSLEGFVSWEGYATRPIDFTMGYSTTISAPSPTLTNEIIYANTQTVSITRYFVQRSDFNPRWLLCVVSNPGTSDCIVYNQTTIFFPDL